MAKVGIVGGLGPASTIDYYRDIIDNFRKIHGDDVYPEIIIDSVNMKEITSRIEEQKYGEVAELILASVSNLLKAGADFAVIASNSPHIAWDFMKDRVAIPVISIIDATCDYIIEQQYKKVLIFATKFTMKNGLYSNALNNRKIEWVLPSEEDIEILGDIIYPNLENGIVIKEDKQKMISIAEKYIQKYNCDSILLGCTEIPLMIKEGDVSVPVINTTQIHIQSVGKILLEK
jgi:aspartate racemase